MINSNINASTSLKWMLLVFGMFLFSSQTFARVYVNQAATGSNDGSSWENAYTDLRTALTLTLSGDVWVAAGTYHPTTPAGDRTINFVLKNGVSLYGGFSGAVHELSLSYQNPVANPTILSGDLNDDDTSASFRAENSLNVLDASNTDASTIISGVTIKGGGGDYTDNLATGGILQAGAGLYLKNASPQVINTIFTENSSRIGSGAYVENGSPTFTDSTFLGNISLRSGEGSGIYAIVTNGSSQQLQVRDSLFQGNRARQGHFATGNGAAIYNGAGSQLIVRDSVFRNNSVWHNNTFGNATRGGAIFSDQPGAMISGSEFYSNYANMGAGIYSTNWLSINNSVFSGNRAVAAGCLITECSDLNKISGYGGGVFILIGTGSSITNSTFSANFAANLGGAVGMQYNSATLLIQNSIIWGNRTTPVCCGEDLPLIVRTQVKGGSPSFLYSIVEGILEVVPGEDPPDPADFPGSLDSAPLFVNADGGPYSGVPDSDLRVMATSPAIDSANNGYVGVGVVVDLDKHLRRADDVLSADTGLGDPPVVDMGAYEYTSPAVDSVLLGQLMSGWGGADASLDLDSSGAVGTADVELLVPYL